MTRHKPHEGEGLKEEAKETAREIIRKRPLTSIALIVGACVLFLPQVSAIFTHFTGIPLSQDAKMAEMIAQKIDGLSQKIDDGQAHHAEEHADAKRAATTQRFIDSLKLELRLANYFRLEHSRSIEGADWSRRGDRVVGRSATERD